MKNKSGFINLALAVSISVGVTVMSMVTLDYVIRTGTTSTDLIQKQKSLLAAEGGIRIAQKISHNYFMSSDTPTSQGLEAYVANQVQALGPMGYQLKNFEAEIIDSGTSMIPSGPFMGMSADINTVKFKLTAQNASETVATTVNQESVLGQIRLFQFSIFSEMAANWNPGPAQIIKGRVHINNDLCYGGNTGLSLDYLTATGRIWLYQNPNCYIDHFAPQVHIFDGSQYVQMKPGVDHDCTNCDGSGQDWKIYAINTWKGRVLDVDHKIPNLKLPGTDSSTPAQKTRDVNGNLISQLGSMRFIVDPVIPIENEKVRENKYAYKADIRIINGVWYLKNPLDATAWPGVPIWSDHPGEFTTTDEEDIEGNQQVGQEDIKGAQSWPSTPRRFSYYEYDLPNQTLTGDNLGVVSYGNLFRDDSAGFAAWRPGHWVNTGVPGQLCPNGYTCTNCVGDIIDSGIPLICANGVDTVHLDRASGLLNATRGGVLNGHIEKTPFGSMALAHLLPMNFDVAQLQEALLDTTPGELGSYFGNGRFMGRDFNGIVYISNTWHESLRGMDDSDRARDWPLQGLQMDPNQPTTAYWAPARTQSALPFQLCSTSAATLNFSGANGRFKVPNCASYLGLNPAIDARTNVVRVFNGRNLSSAALPIGLTIATNLPVYLMGDYNTSSDPSTSSSVPWLPTLIAGDVIFTLSNNWSDSLSRWNSPYVERPASDTTYNTCLLGGASMRPLFGSSPSNFSIGLHVFTRLNENWETRTHELNGAIVIGFPTVYFPYRNVSHNDTYDAPTNRNWTYDPHLYSNKKQPPGTPFFYVHAVKDWYTHVPE